MRTLHSVSVVPNRVSTFWERDRYGGSGNLLKRTKTKQISYHSRGRLQNAINFFLLRSQPKPLVCNEKQYWFRVNFITLTLPAKQMHDDKVIVSECLHRFIDAMRKRWHVEDYLWRAECQLNGNLHFHITTNVFIPWEWVRKQWIKSLLPLGYIHAFSEKFGHSNPNCTDIHAVHNVKNYGAYMSKYLAKNKSFAKVGTLHQLKDGTVKEFSLYDTKKEGRIIASVLSERIRNPTCRTWFCSRSISKMKPLTFSQCDEEYYEVIDMLKEADLHIVTQEHGSSFYGEIFSNLKKRDSIVAKQLKYGFEQIPRLAQPRIEQYKRDLEDAEMKAIEIAESQQRQFNEEMIDAFHMQLALELPLN